MLEPQINLQIKYMSAKKKRAGLNDQILSLKIHYNL